MRPPGVTGSSTKSPFSGSSGCGPRSQHHNQTTFKKPVPFSWLLVQVITQAGFNSEMIYRRSLSSRLEIKAAAAWAAAAAELSVSVEALAKRCRRGVSMCSSDTHDPEQVDGTSPFTSCSGRTFLLRAPSPADVWVSRGSCSCSLGCPGHRGKDRGHRAPSLLL